MQNRKLLRIIGESFDVLVIDQVLLRYFATDHFGDLELMGRYEDGC
jgi:hypothetical protein